MAQRCVTSPGSRLVEAYMIVNTDTQTQTGGQEQQSESIENTLGSPEIEK